MGKTRDMALVGFGAALSRQRVVEVGPREVHHHEHRAPTDESVKLLKELEEKALDKIDETIRIEGNGFNGVIHLMRMDMDETLRARCIYDFNGRKMETEHTVSMYRATGEDSIRDELLTGLRDKIATKLAAEILMGAFDKSVEARTALMRMRS